MREHAPVRASKHPCDVVRREPFRHCAHLNWTYRRLSMPVPSAETVDTVLRHADARLDQSREALFSLLSIPSISAQDVHREDCARAAEWVRDRLVALGFRTEIRPTPGHPVVLGHL